MVAILVNRRGETAPSVHRTFLEPGTRGLGTTIPVNEAPCVVQQGHHCSQHCFCSVPRSQRNSFPNAGSLRGGQDVHNRRHHLLPSLEMIPEDRRSNAQRQGPSTPDQTAPATGGDQDSQPQPLESGASAYPATTPPDRAFPSGSSGDRGAWGQTGSSPPPRASPYRAGSDASINTDARQSGRGRSGSLRSSDGYLTEPRHENQSGEMPSSSSFEHLVVYPDIRRKKVEMACHFCRGEI